MKNIYLQTALRWHGWDANVVAILTGDKGPTYSWKAFQSERQSPQTVRSLPWNGGRYEGRTRRAAWGVGIVNGVGGWRCFDLDHCPERGPVDILLAALGLPPDYVWVVRTGSGNGWHVWFRCLDELPPGTLASRQRAPGVFWGESKTGEFGHLELRWCRCQTLTPPSRHPSGPGYHWAGQLPVVPPALLSVEQTLAGFHAIAVAPAPPPPPAPPQRPRLNGCSRVADEIRGRFDLVAFAVERFGGDAIEEGEQVRITGNGGLLIKPETGQWYCFSAETGGDAIDLVGYACHGALWDRTNREMFPAALREAAAFAGVALPPPPEDEEAEAVEENDETLPQNGIEQTTAERHASATSLAEMVACLDGLGGENPAAILRVAYGWIETLAGMRRADLMQVYEALRAAGVSKARADSWKGAVHELAMAAKRAAHQVSVPGQTLAHVTTSPLPWIVVNDRQLRDVTEDAFAALLRANATPAVFVRGGVLTRVLTDENEHASAQPLEINGLRGVLTRCADFVRQKQVGPETYYLPESSPPAEVVNDLLALPAWPGIPPLLGITTAPVVAPDGTVELSSGYLPKSGLFHIAGELEIGETTPTTESVQQAKQFLLEELLGDFPFADQNDSQGHASRANALALLLLPFVRPMIAGPTPLHFIDAPQAGTGKGLLADAVTLPFAPAGLEIMTAPAQEEEWRKRITAALLNARSHVLIDNVVGTLRSGTLAAALTAPVWSDRILGLSQTVTLPIRNVWIATGNNVQLDTDMARRCVWIRLDAGVERPWLRRTFRHSDLRTWAREHRGELITAALTLIRAWLEAGQPAGKSMGSYEQWARTMHGIMQTVGVEGFLGNADDLYAQKNPEHEAWTTFVEAWWAAHESTPVGVVELFPLASRYDADGPACLDLLGEYLGAGGEQSRKIRLGRALRERLDRVFGEWKIRDAGARQRAQLYRLDQTDPVE